jgi:hypothetical protein
MLGPELVLGAGLGVLFVSVNLVGLTKVDDDTGVASSLVNVGQQVGGSIGLAVAGRIDALGEGGEAGQKVTG